MFVILSCQHHGKVQDTSKDIAIVTFNDIPDDTLSMIKEELRICFDTIKPTVLASESECDAMKHLLCSYDGLRENYQYAYDWLWSQEVKYEMEHYWDSKNISNKYWDPLLDMPLPEELDYLCEIIERVEKSYDSLLGDSQYDLNRVTGIMALTSHLSLLLTYHAADSLLRDMELDLFAEAYYMDYVLWDDLYKEYEENYTDGGSSTPMILNSVYSTYSETRKELLKEEIGYFTEKGAGARWLSREGDIQWEEGQEAIRRWYDYRMKVAQQLEGKGYGHNTIEYYRHITYKAVYIYQRLQTGWGYEFEQL